jgi:hypothetical protein
VHACRAQILQALRAIRVAELRHGLQPRAGAAYTRPPSQETFPLPRL